MHISLRAGERFYINGAVLRVDRKVSFELLNDATFLLDAHVMRVEEVTTPLRQLYFIVQIMLMNPADSPAATEMFEQALRTTKAQFDDPAIRVGLEAAERFVHENRKFDALKSIRKLLPLEQAKADQAKSPMPERAA
jgi:flagellar biosynthesis repressor protein FlbT